MLRRPWTLASPLLTFFLLRCLSGDVSWGAATVVLQAHGWPDNLWQQTLGSPRLPSRPSTLSLTLLPHPLPHKPRLFWSAVRRSVTTNSLHMTAHLSSSHQQASHLHPPPPSPSGIPPLERGWAERYGGQPAFEQYKASTNLLVPWPPRDKFP